jgi:hypothetical protein
VLAGASATLWATATAFTLSKAAAVAIATGRRRTCAGGFGCFWGAAFDAAFKKLLSITSVRALKHRQKSAHGLRQDPADRRLRARH